MKIQFQYLRQVLSRYPQALKLVWQANPRYHVATRENRVSIRLSTVCMAQQILVLENGQLIEEETYTELIARYRQYAKMFTTQAEPYL